MTYIISYEKNGVYQAIGVNAQTAEQATAYFAQYKPTARYIDIREGMENKPGLVAWTYQCWNQSLSCGCSDNKNIYTPPRGGDGGGRRHLTEKMSQKVRKTAEN